MAARSLKSVVAESTAAPVIEGRGVQLGSEDAVAGAVGWRRSQEWQRDGWRFYDVHGEVHYPLTVGGNLSSRVDLAVEERGSDGSWGHSTGKLERSVLESVSGLGLDDFFRSLWLNTAVAGEGVLVVTPEYGSYDIEVFSSDEVYKEANGAWVRVDETGRREVLDLREKRVTRFWRSHPRYRRSADSGLRSVLNECRELELLKLSLLAKITSRLASVGILFLPNSLSMPVANPEASAGTLSGDALTQMLVKLFMSPIRNPGASAAAMPVILRGPEEAGEKIRHIILDTSLDEVEENHRAELRRAIANGIELPIETQTSVADANRWNAWNISESAVRDHILPVCRAGAGLLTTRVLWPILRREGMAEADVRRRRFWPNVDRAALGLNRSDLARQLFDRGQLGGDALRLAHGFDESSGPTDEEFIRFLGIKLSNPAMASWGLDLPPEMLMGALPPGPGGFNAPEPHVDSWSTVGDPNGGLDRS